VNSELAPVKIFIFPVNFGYRFQRVEKKIIRLAPCGKKEKKEEGKDISGKSHRSIPPGSILYYTFFAHSKISPVAAGEGADPGERNSLGWKFHGGNISA
jgi:hypothetical protein